MMRVFLSIAGLITTSFAVECVDYKSNKASTTCLGDLCYEVGSGLLKGCLNGSTYLEDGCYYAQKDNFFICLCSLDDCNLLVPNGSISATSSLIQWGGLTIPLIAYPEIDCYYGNYTSKLNSIPAPKSTDAMRGQFCKVSANYDMTKDEISISLTPSSPNDGLFGIHPPYAQSQMALSPFYFGGIYQFQVEPNRTQLQMICDWDICNSIKSTTWPGSNVWCHMNDTKATCEGEYCFILQHGDHSPIFGCLSQETSLAAGRVQVGNYNFDTGTYLICAEAGCNEGLEKAQASITSYEPVLPAFEAYTRPPVTSTTNLSPNNEATTVFPDSTTTLLSTIEPVNPITGTGKTKKATTGFTSLATTEGSITSDSSIKTSATRIPVTTVDVADVTSKVKSTSKTSTTTAMPDGKTGSTGFPDQTTAKALDLTGKPVEDDIKTTMKTTKAAKTEKPTTTTKKPAKTTTKKPKEDKTTTMPDEIETTTPSSTIEKSNLLCFLLILSIFLGL